MSRYYFMALILSASLWSHPFDHLKKISINTDEYRYGNIDCVFIINLDERPEKYNRCIKQLAPLGVTPYRFSAVNGWRLTPEQIESVGLEYKEGMRKGIVATRYPKKLDGLPLHEEMVPGRVYLGHCFARGTVGIALSHLSILKFAYENKLKRVWIMEDDINVVDHPKKVVSYLKELEQIVGKKKWDLFFTDIDTVSDKGERPKCTGYNKQRPDYRPGDPKRFKIRKNINKHIRQVGARFGAYSYIISRRGMKKILDFYDKHRIYLPYDMDMFFPTGMKVYSTRADVISHRCGALSDNGGPTYLGGEEDKYFSDQNKEIKK